MGAELPEEGPSAVVALEQQLLRHAADLRTSLLRERDSQRQLSAIVAQLQAFTVDLRKAVRAERERSRELEAAYLDTLLRLARASAFRDEETQNHAERLGRYAYLLASELGLPARECEILGSVAPLHDLGKIGVPDAVLLSPGRLDAEAWKIMRRHPAIGASLLRGSSSERIETARLVALTHHEAWDGSGYPQGLRGEEIPLAGRIVQLSDVYDALRSARPYKPALSHDEASSILLIGDGRTQPGQFDPRLLEIFRSVHAGFAEIYERLADE